MACNKVSNWAIIGCLFSTVMIYSHFFRLVVINYFAKVILSSLDYFLMIWWVRKDTRLTIIGHTLTPLHVDEFVERFCDGEHVANPDLNVQIRSFFIIAKVANWFLISATGKLSSSAKFRPRKIKIDSQFRTQNRLYKLTSRELYYTYSQGLN